MEYSSGSNKLLVGLLFLVRNHNLTMSSIFMVCLLYSSGWLCQDIWFRLLSGYCKLTLRHFYLNSLSRGSLVNFKLAEGSRESSWNSLRS